MATASSVNSSNLTTVIWSNVSTVALQSVSGAVPMSRHTQGVVTLLYASLIVVAVGGNVVVCCTVASQRRMHTVTNLFIASLSVSDVLMAVLCIPLTFIADVIVQHWPFPPFLCPLALYVQVTLLTLPYPHRCHVL